MPDYKNGKVYRIVCRKTALVYYGSTVQDLDKRLWGHRNEYKKYVQDGQKYITSFDIYKGEDYYIELVQLVPCENKKELETVERRFIEANTCVNKYIPTRTPHEYHEVHKKERGEYQKTYSETHSEKKREYAKRYREINKTEINAKEKLFRENHKTQLSESNKAYREKRRDEIRIQRKAYRERKKEENTAT